MCGSVQKIRHPNYRSPSLAIETWPKEPEPLLLHSEVEPPVDLTLSPGINQTNEGLVPTKPIPAIEEHRSAYDLLHLDPRFFLLISPSSYSIRKAHQSFIGHVQDRERVITTQISSVKFFPWGLDHFWKSWNSSPSWWNLQQTTIYLVLNDVTNQTEKDIHHPEKVDAVTQCSVAADWLTEHPKTRQLHLQRRLELRFMNFTYYTYSS